MIQKLISILILSSFGGLLAIAAPIDSVKTPTQTTEKAPAPSVVMGFQEWKKNRVFDAKMNLDKFKSPQLSKQAETPENPQASSENVENSGDKAQNTETASPNEELAKSLPQPGETPANEESAKPLTAEEKVAQEKQMARDAEKLRQLEFNMEIAQGLTIHDYFALYLKNKNPQEMAEAIKQLSPEELSELLMAYRKALYGVPSGAGKAVPVAPKSL